MYVVGARHPCGKRRRRVLAQRIEGEPSSPRWSGSTRVWRNDFKIYRIAKPQKKIVRSHAGMFSAGLWRNPKAPVYEFRPGFQRRRGDGNMVDEAARHSKPPN